MSTVSHGGLGSSRHDLMTCSSSYVSVSSGSNELDSVRKQLELLKSVDPFKAVEMALEIQNERKKVQDAMNARDAAVTRLADAYLSLGQKTAMIEKLQTEIQALSSNKNSGSYNKVEKGISTSTSTSTTDHCKAYKENTTRTEIEKADAHTIDFVKLQQVARLETLVSSLTEEIETLRANKDKAKGGLQKEDAAGPLKFAVNPFVYHRTTPLSRSSSESLSVMSSMSSSESISGMSIIPLMPQSSISDFSSISSTDSVFWLEDYDFDFAVVRTAPPSGEAEDIINSRNKLLASIPLPEEAPDDTLKPIMIPSPYTLHDFLSTAPESLRNSLTNYRALQQLTTSWCPEREEHGYFLTPAFKCHTNPRVSMAHKWTAAEMLSKLNKPTECFYHKDGVWYYAGIYKAFRLDDLTTKEWEALSSETMQAIIKETIAGRKNTSPQNVYEVGQLYAAGALKVACVALQCIGFNRSMYKAILDHVDKCQSTGKWKSTPLVSTLSSSSFSSSSSGSVTSMSSIGSGSGLGSGYGGNHGHGPNRSHGRIGSTSSSSVASLGLGSGTVWNVNANADLTGALFSMSTHSSSSQSASGRMSETGRVLGSAEVGSENVPTIMGTGRGKR